MAQVTSNIRVKASIFNALLVILDSASLSVPIINLQGECHEIKDGKSLKISIIL
jgi:hypothetical protein